MIYNSLIIQILLILNLNLIIKTNSEEEFNLQNFLAWCKNNSIIISPKIKFSFENNLINVTASVDVPSKTELVSIPDKMILTVDKI